MEKLKVFFKTTFLGGFLVVLPVIIAAVAVGWFFNLLTGLLQPLTNLITSQTGLPELVGDILAGILIILICFVVGFFVKTRIGGFFYDVVEKSLLKKIPGFSLIKETVLQFFGGQELPFSSVALAQIFENNTLVTAFITDKHLDGSYTVFVPTGPNPTSGNIFHLKAQYVHVLDTPIEEAMKTIISCGTGSKKIVEKLKAGN